jgi:predicted DNA-binding transcriptional regulator YafY
MRAERLISILMLLQTRRHVTARELAERLEVSERTVYRDVEALSAAGIPIYTERGPGGGCKLTDGYRSNLTGLNENELRSLLVPGFSPALPEGKGEKTRDAALLKVLAALPAVQRRSIEHARERLFFDPRPWFVGEAITPFLPLLREAVWHDRYVRLFYHKPSAEVVERLVEPLGLVSKAGIWYLVGRNKQQMRVYRLSRVRDVEVLEETFERPLDFDLERYWTEWSANFQESIATYSVTVRVAPEFLPILPMIMGESVRQLIREAGPGDEKGHITLTLRFESKETTCSFILGFIYRQEVTPGSSTFVPGIEILEPPEMRQAVLECARKIVALYNVE